MDHTFVNRELSLFSYEILGLVGPNGAGAHDLLRMARHGRILDWAGESQYYVEPKRLAKLGYLTARVEPGKTRPRTVYTLTDKGRDALNAWARTAVRFTPVKSELLIRLLIADRQLDVLAERVPRLSRIAHEGPHPAAPRCEGPNYLGPCVPRRSSDHNHGLVSPFL